MSFSSTRAIETEKPSMKLRSLVTTVCMSILVSAAPALAALPTVDTFTVAATAVSPVPVTAFTASDSDGTVVGYMITQTSTKPAAGDARWTGTPWTSFETTSLGSRTLYAWAKDNANGVSNSRTATTNVVGGHVHPIGQVTGLTDALAGKADASHNHDGAYQKKYANVVVVAKSGGDFDSLEAAMASITDASASNPYLVRIMPGVYTIEPLFMKAFVDVEGAGKEVTTLLTGGGAGLGNLVYGTSYGGGLGTHSELRDITVVATGAIPAIAVYGDMGDSAFDFTHVRIVAEAIGISFGGGGGSNKATLTDVEMTCGVGVWMTASNDVVSLRNTRVTATSSAIHFWSGMVARLEVLDSQLVGTQYGIEEVAFSSPGSVELRNSLISGGTAAISIPAGQSVYAANSQFVGPVDNLGVFKTFSCYDGNFDPLP
jgi:hypothetical protein